MYKVDLENKEVKELKPIKFSDIKVKERFDIEEWIRKNPKVLKENLIIISEQKVLPSRRQPDLVALDKEGNLVIVELKRDDTGKEVHWQAITYAAQLSEYSANDIIEMFEEYLKKIGKDPNDAKSKIAEFVEGKELEEINQKQRIILVSREFHQDVLKAAKWLSEDYGIDIKCVRLVPYKDKEGNILLNSEILIPTPGLEEYIKRRTIKKKESGVHPYRSPFSIDKGDFDMKTLRKKLKETLSMKTKVIPRFIAFLKILLSEDRKFSRREVKERLFAMGIGSNIGQTGTLLSNISQLLTRKSTPHLRQIIDFKSKGTSGSKKDDFRILPQYRQLVKEVLEEIENKRSEK